MLDIDNNVLCPILSLIYICIQYSNNKFRLRNRRRKLKENSEEYKQKNQAYVIFYSVLQKKLFENT